MYTQFYGLDEKPFGLVPNPAYLYLSERHHNALTYLEYGLMEKAGFILLTGDIGMGKTTLIRHVLNNLESNMEVAVIFNTMVFSNDLLHLILSEFEIEFDAGLSKAAALELLYQYLIACYAERKKVLLVIDEAQHLSHDVLEEIRMISNLQTDDEMLIQIMLVGQTELKEKLGSASLRQFAQRIAVSYHLSPMNAEETAHYIAHRLEIAGGHPDLFEPVAIERIIEASGGIPRIINMLCDACLVYGFADAVERISPNIVEQVLDDRGGMGLYAKDDGIKSNLSESDAIPKSNLTDELSEIKAMLKGYAGRLSTLEKETSAAPDDRAIDEKLDAYVDRLSKLEDALTVLSSDGQTEKKLELYDNRLSALETLSSSPPDTGVEEQLEAYADRLSKLEDALTVLSSDGQTEKKLELYDSRLSALETLSSSPPDSGVEEQLEAYADRLSKLEDALTVLSSDGQTEKKLELYDNRLSALETLSSSPPNTGLEEQLEAYADRLSKLEDALTVLSSDGQTEKKLELYGNRLSALETLSSSPPDTGVEEQLEAYADRLSKLEDALTVLSSDKHSEETLELYGNRLSALEALTSTLQDIGFEEKLEAYGDLLSELGDEISKLSHREIAVDLDELPCLNEETLEKAISDVKSQIESNLLDIDTRMEFFVDTLMNSDLQNQAISQKIDAFQEMLIAQKKEITEYDAGQKTLENHVHQIEKAVKSLYRSLKSKQ